MYKRIHYYLCLTFATIFPMARHISWDTHIFNFNPDMAFLGSLQCYGSTECHGLHCFLLHSHPKFFIYATGHNCRPHCRHLNVFCYPLRNTSVPNTMAIYGPATRVRIAYARFACVLCMTYSACVSPHYASECSFACAHTRHAALFRHFLCRH